MLMIMVVYHLQNFPGNPVGKEEDDFLETEDCQEQRNS